MTTTGARAVVELLAESGVRYLFGNPGSTEMPLMDALAGQDRLQYILALQEVPAMAMADGYAQASRSAGVVNVHIGCGLGNAMGMLYNAWRAGAPLLLTAGQQDRRLAFEEPVLWGDLVSVARPWTKWAAEVRRVEDLPQAIRRALKTALTPPTGPVFLALPVDVQMETAELDVAPMRLPDAHVRPPLSEIARAAQTLALARNPAVLAGSRVCEAGAAGELAALAERLGAPVFHDSQASHNRGSIPPSHPLAAGMLPLWSPDIRARLAEFDVLLAAGVDLFQQYIYHEPSRPIPEGIRIVQVDVDPWEMAKNYPVEAGLLGHLKPALAELLVQLESLMTPEQVDAARDRCAARARAHAAEREALRRKAEEQFDARPLTPLCLMHSLARVLPDDVAVVEEAPTTTLGYLERSGLLRTGDGYFAHKGWALGWGLNCAIGVRLAWPGRPVLAVIGDGAALYGCQGLWTAARYRLPVTFVVANNRQYRILKEGARIMKVPGASAGRFIGLDLVEPEVDYVGLARSFGVDARRITEPDELSDAVRESFAADAPVLLDVRTGHSEALG
ncbi:MAG: thiamine pyrophosphate-binding protein [Bryobacteraceae bacterium]|nr:thiamine pyrophosphate-binding protein [Bryobacteraceae bacterium]